jgi:hypothetical protein
MAFGYSGCDLVAAGSVVDLAYLLGACEANEAVADRSDDLCRDLASAPGPSGSPGFSCTTELGGGA